jgi:hypothetical protein
MTASIATLSIVAAMSTSTLLATAATTPGPIWKIISYASPTNLVPNSPANEADELTVSASGGTFTLSVKATGVNNFIPVTTSPIPYNASPAEVQGALDTSLAFEFEEGKVVVAPGSSGANSYLVTFTEGSVADHVVHMTVDGSALTGGSPLATIRQLTPGEPSSQIHVIATDVGGGPAEGGTSQIAVGDALPAPLTATSVEGVEEYGDASLECSTPPTVNCTYAGKVEPGDTLSLTIKVSVPASGFSSSVLNQATVEGGRAAPASVQSPMAISLAPVGFGIAPGSTSVALSTPQAGAHPNLTTSFVLNTRTPEGTAGPPRDLHFNLPPGLVGSAVGLPQCPTAAAAHFRCSSGTIVGIATATIDIPAFSGSFTFTTPVYNITPLPGEPAAFEFTALSLPVRLDTSVLANGNYGVRVTAPTITELEFLLASSVTIWGVPADHNGPGSIGFIFSGETAPLGGPNPAVPRVALLSNPTQCSTPLEATLEVDPWTEPGAFQKETTSMGTPTGCTRLPFNPTFSFLPDNLEAGAPAAYTTSINVPQGENPDGLATAQVKDVTMALPSGTVLSPSAASGLEACSSEAFALHSGTPGACPPQSQIATVQIESPSLAKPLPGRVFVGEPECDPCTPGDAQGGRMVRLFLQAQGEGEDGVIVKLEGRARIGQPTGQIVASFENTPQLPFNELKLTLKSGPRTPLANPRGCGPVRASLDLTPWSTPFTVDATPSFSFAVNSGCFGPQFAPSLIAGTTNPQAGQFSPFTLSFSRHDPDQYFGSVKLQMPPGLLGKVSSVPLCREPQAAQGSCGAQSLLGHARILAGPGSTPYVIEGGQVFLTDGYRGAPFGLSIVVPATAGPYTLAGTSGHGAVVVRAAISVDPHTSQIAISSDPLPESLDGIPLQVRTVNVTIDRPEFIFNPTDCEPLSIAGTLVSAQATSTVLSSHFQAANCAALPFKPTFALSSQAKTSKANGASLRVKVTSRAGQANIGRVKVDLPKQLPSRLTTLQKACVASVFEANPAACPATSLVGTATARTPVLTAPLTGPAYLVSHGGTAFPDLVIVLQGEGVTFELDGLTGIKKGVTSSTFGSVPDAPISTFELTLPEGPHSILSTNLPPKAKRSLCGQSLVAPTAITGQNGATIMQSTKIAITGCPRRRTVHRAHSVDRGRRRRPHSAASSHQ